MVKIFEVAGRKVGVGQPCFIIAEAGVNHNGKLDIARRLVNAAKASGADAVKFQTFRAEDLVTADAPKAAYQERNTGGGESQFEMLKRLELTADDYRELAAYCRRQEIAFVSTPFDHGSVDLLAEIGVPLFKTPSGEITNLPYLAHIARLGRPMIVSTGMSYLGEVEAAVRRTEAAGAPPICLMHCVSNYPAAPADVNLRAMQTLATAFQVPVGYSDHTEGGEVAMAAVALGACVLEKHLTLDRSLPGPDHQASLEPEEFAAFVRGIRVVEAALGDGRKAPAASEAGVAAVARKSIVLARDVAAGAVLTPESVTIKRPGTGLPPSLLPTVLGRTARTALRAGTVITFEHLA